jgi:hypothetical protein
VSYPGSGPSSLELARPDGAKDPRGQRRSRERKSRFGTAFLLPQPGDFEGVGVVREPMLANDLSPPEGENDPVVELDPSAGLPAAQVISQMRQDLVAPGINEFDVADARPADSVEGVENRAVAYSEASVAS